MAGEAGALEFVARLRDEATASAKGLRGRIESAVSGPVDGVEVPVTAKDKTGPTFASVGKRMDAIGRKAQATGLKITAIGTTAALAMGKKLVDSASNAVEANAKVNVVFGDQAKAVEAWSKTATASVYMTAAEAQEAAGTFGNLLVALKIPQKEAANLSMDMVALAADIGSLNNVNADEVLLALKSGLAGEAEPMKRFGVNINQAAIEAEALRSGLVKSVADTDKVAAARARFMTAQEKANKVEKDATATAAERMAAVSAVGLAEKKLKDAIGGTVPPLTAQQKALATANLIMAQTKTAQGDVARSAGTVAANQRKSSAEFRQFVETLGKDLMPIATEFLKWATKGTAYLAKMDPTVRNLALGALALGAALGPVVTIIGTLTRVGGAFVSGTGKTISSVVSITKAVKSGGAEGGKWARSFVLNGRLVGQSVKGAASSISGLTKDTAKSVAQAGKWAVAQGVAAAKATIHTARIIAQAVAQRAIAAATRAWAAAQWLINAAMSANPFGLVLLAVAALAVAFVVAWRKSERFRDVVKTTMKKAGEFVQPVVDVIGKIVSAVGDVITKITGSGGMKAAIGGAKGVVDGLAKAVSGIADAIGWVIEKVEALIGKLDVLPFVGGNAITSLHEDLEKKRPKPPPAAPQPWSGGAVRDPERSATRAIVAPVQRPARETVTLRHEVAFTGPGAERLNAREVAAMLSRDAYASAAVERALTPARTRANAGRIMASR